MLLLLPEFYYTTVLNKIAQNLQLSANYKVMSYQLNQNKVQAVEKLFQAEISFLELFQPLGLFKITEADFPYQCLSQNQYLSKMPDTHHSELREFG